MTAVPITVKGEFRIIACPSHGPLSQDAIAELERQRYSPDMKLVGVPRARFCRKCRVRKCHEAAAFACTLVHSCMSSAAIRCQP